MVRLPFFVLTALVALALAVPAAATPPLSEDATDASLEAVDCGGFDAVLERHFTGRITVFFDSTGNPVRVQVHAAMTGSITNSVTGTSVPLRGDVFVIDDFASGVTTFVGPVFLANQPGLGSVITETGRISFSGDEIVFEAGPHDLIDNTSLLCDAVA
ncbi:MAG TPA: hypothetical protein VFU26_01905 [Gaiellaceae bacterium]|nr:hypothetical protein [Gaiellaceae bacterium]